MKAESLRKVKGVLSVEFQHPITGFFFAKIDPTMVETDRYQREFVQNHAAFIIGDFQPMALGTPYVSARGGKLYAIDGNHTIHVCMEMGMTAVWVWLNAIPFEKEALLFHIKNNGKNNKRMNPAAEFNSAIMAGKPLETAILAICRGEGFTTTYDVDGKRGRADLKSISILRDAALYKMGSYADLRKFLKLLKAFRVHGILDAPAKLNPFQRGLYDYMKDNPKVSAAEFLRKIRSYSAGTITSKAAEIACSGRADRNHFRKVFENIMA
jgi:hypothetical protein